MNWFEKAILESKPERDIQMNIDHNPLNAKLNPICPLLALLGSHPILHVSRF